MYLLPPVATSGLSWLRSSKVPRFKDAIRIADTGRVPAGSRTNEKTYEPFVEWSARVSDAERILMNDAQTSGGLLIFVPEEKRAILVSALESGGILAAHIGDIVDEGMKDTKRIFVD